MPTTPAFRSRPERWLPAFFVAHLILTLGVIEMRSSIADESAFWGLAGLSSAVLAQVPIRSRRWFIAALAGSCGLSYVIVGSPLPLAVSFAAANGVQAGVAAHLLRKRLPQGRRIVRLQDIGWLVAAAVASASAGVAAAGLGSWALAPGIDVATLGTFFMVNMVGIVIGAPVLLALFSLRAEPPRAHLGVPAMVVAAGTLAVVAGAFTASASTGRNFSYLIVVPVMVSAVWLGQRHTAILVGGLAVAMAFGTSRGVGPFAITASSFDPLLSVQLFMSVVQLTALTVGVEATRRKDVIAELDGILAATVEGVFVVDDSGTIRHSNSGGEDILGAPLVDLVGMPLSDFVPLDLDEDEALHLVEARKVGGAPFWAEISRGEIRERSGRRRTAVVVRDVTGRIETEEKVRRIQDEFVAYMTHQLKTPLTAIIGFSEWLLAEPDSPTLTDDLGTIRDSAMSMKGLIDDILDFKRVAIAEAARETVDMKRLVAESVDKIVPAAIDRDVVIAVELDATSTVCGDVDQLEHAVQNILSNAVKYSKPGGRVEVALSEADDTVVLSVVDQGIGIPEDDLGGLFERFYRAANTADVHGTGLGLALVKQVVVDHGGQVELSSVLGEGTHVRVALPIEPSTPLPSHADTRLEPAT